MNPKARKPSVSGSASKSKGTASVTNGAVVNKRSIKLCSRKPRSVATWVLKSKRCSRYSIGEHTFGGADMPDGERLAITATTSGDGLTEVLLRINERRFSFVVHKKAADDILEVFATIRDRTAKQTDNRRGGLRK